MTHEEGNEKNRGLGKGTVLHDCYFGGCTQTLTLSLMNALFVIFREPSKASLVHINASLMAVHFPLSLYLLVFWLLPIIYYLCWDLFVLQKVILLRRIHFKMSSGLYFPKISNNYLSPREYSCFIAPLFVETVNSHFCPSPPAL